MGTTAEEVYRLLGEKSLRCHIDPVRGTIVVNLSKESAPRDLLLLIFVKHEGQLLHIQTFNFLSCPEELSVRSSIEAELLSLNSDYRLVRWGIDGDDVVASADLVLMDAKMTEQQFYSTLQLFGDVVGKAIERLNEAVNGFSESLEDDVMDEIPLNVFTGTFEA